MWLLNELDSSQDWASLIGCLLGVHWWSLGGCLGDGVGAWPSSSSSAWVVVVVVVVVAVVVISLVEVNTVDGVVCVCVRSVVCCC